MIRTCTLLSTMTLMMVHGAMGGQDRVNGIQILNPQGKEVRFLDTSPYVPMMLAFDANDHLWTIGWERDAANNGREQKQDYFLARKF